MAAGCSQRTQMCLESPLDIIRNHSAAFRGMLHDSWGLCSPKPEKGGGDAVELRYTSLSVIRCFMHAPPL